MHIYESFEETKFKAPIFIASFLASVFCYLNANDEQTNVAVGSAALLYGLSLISEVWMLLDPGESFRAKLFKGTIFLDGLVAIALGINLVSAKKHIFPANHTIMICAISAIVFLIDLLLYYWVRPPATHLNNQEDNLKEMDVGGFEK